MSTEGVVADVRPIIVITMGDPAGVGPEVTVKALSRDEVWECCRPMVVGDAAVLERAIRLVGAVLTLREIADASNARHDSAAPDVVSLSNVDIESLAWGQVSAAAGRARRTT